MALHRFYYPQLGAGPGNVQIEGEEARHAARVKRLRLGEAVEVISGDGRRAAAAVSEIRKQGQAWVVDLAAEASTLDPPPSPLVEVCSPPPKGERLERMIDQLSQVGAWRWCPLVTERSGPPPRPGKLDRLQRVAIEAAKQCGRSRLLEIGAPVALAEALARTDGWAVTMVDAEGDGAPETSHNLRILVGPEGGWTGAERAAAEAAGARLVRLGALTMRVELAAVVGAAVALAGAPRP